MAGVKLLDAFVRIFADQTELRKAYRQLEGDASEQGRKTGAAFQAGFASVTPRRAGGAGPPLQTLEGTRVGGLVVPEGASPFSSAGQALGRARGAAGGGAERDLEEPFRRGKRAADEFGLSARDAAGTVRLLGLGVLSELNPAVGATATVAIEAARNLKGLGVGIAAGGAAAAVAATLLTLYVGKVKAAQEAQVALDQAVRRGDTAAVGQQAQKNADDMVAFATQSRLAAQEVNSLGSASETIVAFWTRAFGPSLETLTDRAKTTREAFEELFFSLEVPKQRLQATADAAKLTQGQVGLDREAAQTTAQLADATDRLVAARRRQAEAEAGLVRQEAVEIQRQQRDGVITQAVATERLADVERRAAAVITQSEQDVTRSRREGARAVADLRAQEIQGAEASAAQARRRRDAVLAAAAQVVEVEAQANLSLEEAFRARTRLQDESTANLVRDLRAESEARREALRARLEGATGTEAAAIERELTQVTAEETAKRTELEVQAAAQRVALIQRERQERLAQAEQLFGIARTLGTRRVQDEMATQAQIAQAARTGSSAQIAALQRVAELTAQVQGQARSLAQQAIGIVQQQAQRLGLEGPAFVSQASLQRGLEQQRRRDEAVRQQFAAGRAVRTEELTAAVGQQPFFEQFRQFGADFGQVFRDATTPLREAFASTVGPALTEQLDALTERARTSVTSLVDGLSSAFGKVPDIVGQAMDAALQRVEAGTSQIVGSITRMVEDQLTRSLADAARRI